MSASDLRMLLSCLRRRHALNQYSKGNADAFEPGDRDTALDEIIHGLRSRLEAARDVEVPFDPAVLVDAAHRDFARDAAGDQRLDCAVTRRVGPEPVTLFADLHHQPI